MPKARPAVTVAGAAAIAAFTLVLHGTEPPGPGMDPDSLSYIGAAESFARGHGLRVPVAHWASPDTTMPLAHFPPGQSLAAALPIRLGMSPTQGTRLIVALSAAGGAAIVTALLTAVVGVLPAAAAGMALAASPLTASAYLSAMSEPLFIALLAATLAAMVCAPARPLGYGTLAALAMMVRYAGASLWAASGIWALSRPGPWSARWRRALLAVAPGIVLQGAWVARTIAVSTAGSIRELRPYGADLTAWLAQAAETITAWLVPWDEGEAWRGRVALVAVFFLAAIVARGAGRAVQMVRDRSPSERRSNADHADEPRLLAATALCAACYAAVVLVSKVVADPNIPFDERMFAPLIVLVTVGGLTAAVGWWRGAGRVLRAVALAAFAVWLTQSALATRGVVEYALDVGIDFASDGWRNSELVRWVRSEGDGRELFTNWPVATYLYAGRPSHQLPAGADSAVAISFRTSLVQRRGVLVVFNAQSPDAPQPDSLAARGGLRLLATRADGRVYGP